MSTTIGDVTVPRVDQGGPFTGGVFMYLDISSIDNVAKNVGEPKVLAVSDAPSRARQRIRPRDVLVSMTRPNLNAVAMVPEELSGAVASTGFDVLRAVEIEPAWLFAAVRSRAFVGTMSELVQGALYPAVRPTDVRSFGIPLPPLAEQMRILERMDALQGRSRAARKALQAIPPLLEQFRQSVLAAAFRGDLTADWRNGECATWESVTMGALASHVTSGSRGWADHYSQDGAVFIRAQNIRDDFLDLTDVAFVRPPPGSESARTRVVKGDLLITITGANVTKAALVDEDPPEAYINQHIALVRLRDPECAKFLYLWTTSTARGRAFLREAAYGGGKPGLNLTNIREMPVMLPRIEEQRQIVRRVELLFARASRIEREATILAGQTEDLSQSVLAKAFRGELVPQDPNDEPASVLLERIRAERAQAGTGRQRRGATR